MEFRCRLGTPGGDIVEGVYAAESEARLRHEFEEKGLYVLAIQRAGHMAFTSLKMPRRARISTREFLVFNQELATLLKAGMPLVQSLEILRQRVANPLLKSVLDDVHERVRGGNSLSEAFEAHGALFPGVYTASLLAGEKSGKPRAGHPPVRRLRQSRVGGEAEDDLGAGLPGHPAGAIVHRRGHHRAESGSGVRDLLQPVRQGTAALDPDDRGVFGVCAGRIFFSCSLAVLATAAASGRG